MMTPDISPAVPQRSPRPGTYTMLAAVAPALSSEPGCWPIAVTYSGLSERAGGVWTAQLDASRADSITMIIVRMVIGVLPDIANALRVPVWDIAAFAKALLGA